MVSSPRVLPMGERALLVEVGSLDAVLALHGRLEASRPDGIVDLVPAARTVLVRIDPRRLSLAAARSWIVHAPEAERAATTREAPLVELDAVYDGPDLAETAELLGLGPGELVRRHTAAEWTVAFTGFAPGFGYLVSPAWPFDVPRLGTPRTRVPAGAVGLAAGFAGAYPRETPGGWRLIAETSAPLWVPDAAAPALLTPGARVRFRPAPVRLHPTAETAGGPHGLSRQVESQRWGGALRVVEPGLLATVQDLGRPGAASLGVASSGALDRAALRAANRLVGNSEAAAGIEITMGGFHAVAERDGWFAVTGAWGRVLLDGHEVDPYEAHAWPAGAELEVDWFTHGARAYLAVRGGIEATRMLGSQSTDVLAGLGPPPLRAGDVLAAGTRAAPIPPQDIAPWGPPHDDEIEVALAPGPRADWFAASAHRDLFDEVWTVTNHADRVGVRLDGPALARQRTGELPSEGMVPGALQVPPSGRPVILLADGPVTGGYPVIAVATDASLGLIAQARPGTRIRFRHARAAL